MNTRTQIIFDACQRMGGGQKFRLAKEDQYIRNPVFFREVIRDVDRINDFYQLLKRECFGRIIRTDAGCIKKGVLTHNLGRYDVYKDFTESGIFRGVIITVTVAGYVFVYKIGNYKVKDSELTGRRAFRRFEKECEKCGVDLNKYRVQNGLQMKSEINPPLIFIPYRSRYREIPHVYHLDINSAWPAGVCKTFPEFTEVFKNLRKYDTLVSNMALGFCQSQYCGYSLVPLAKAGINNTNEYIRVLSGKLASAGFVILGYNTDGIYYRSVDGENRAYHDEDEGSELGQWKNDIQNVVFYACGDGQYYFIDESGKMNVRARGVYGYELYKPREEWTGDDFRKAMSTFTSIVWDDNIGFKILGEKSFLKTLDKE